MKNWLKLVRAPFVSVTVGGITIGSLYPLWKDGIFHWGRFLLALVAGVLLHFATNVANDYFDYLSGTDRENRVAIPPFSGGSRVLLEGKISPGAALAAAILMTLVAAAIGLYLNYILPGNTLLYIGLIGVFLIYSYNGLLKLVRFYLGEIAIFLAWGPLMVEGSYFIQTGKLSKELLPISFMLGILTLLILFINEFADEEADRKTGRRMWIHLFGRKNSTYVHLILNIIAFGCLAYSILSGTAPVISALAFLALPLAYSAFLHAKRNVNEPHPKFLPAVIKTINTYNLSFLLLVVSILAASFIWKT